jgi:hypothetical protein
MIVLPRESVELVPVPVRVDGRLVTTGVQVTLTQGAERPTVWRDADVLDGQTGILVDGRPVGVYEVWARVLSVPEQPVVLAGKIRIT